MKNRNVSPAHDAPNQPDEDSNGFSRRKVFGMGALVVFGAVVGPKIDVPDMFNRDNAEVSVAKREHAHTATHEIAHRYKSCELVAIADTHEPYASPVDYPQYDGDYPRSGVVATFAVERNNAAEVYADAYAEDNTVVWEDPSVDVELSANGEDWSPVYEPITGYTLDDTIGYTPPPANTMDVKVYPRSDAVDGAQLRFTVHSHAYDNSDGSMYQTENRQESSIECAGRAVYDANTKSWIFAA